MARYVLAWEYDNIDSYNDNGIQVEFFKSNEEDKMHERVNQLASTNHGINIILAGFISEEYIYKPINRVTEYLPEIKKQ